MEDVKYERWIRYLLEIADLFDVTHSPLLDITCGTGNSLLPFTKKGIKSIGVDSSFEMLEVAKQKFPHISFIQAEAQSLPFSSHFNLAVSIFDSLNYILDYNELIEAFDSVAETLLPGGHFIFDMNTPYGLETIAKQNTRQESADLISVWRNEYNKKERLLTLHLTLFIKKGNSWLRIDEIHRERGYPEAKIREGLKRVGFKVLGTFKCFELSTVDRFTRRILFIVRI